MPKQVLAKENHEHHLINTRSCSLRPGGTVSLMWCGGHLISEPELDMTVAT